MDGRLTAPRDNISPIRLMDYRNIASASRSSEGLSLDGLDGLTRSVMSVFFASTFAAPPPHKDALPA